MKGAGANLHIKWLQDDAAVSRPKLLQGQNQALESSNIRGGL